MEATGQTGTITFADGVVTIRRRAFIGEGREVRTLRIEDIGSVDYRPASAFEPGFIRVRERGITEKFSIALDGNAIGYLIDQQEPFAALYAALYLAVYRVPADVDTLRSPPISPAIALTTIIGLITIVIWWVWALT